MSNNKIDELKSKLQKRTSHKLSPLQFKSNLNEEQALLFDIGYYSSRLVSEQQFKGYLPFLTRVERKAEELENELAEIKTLLQELLKK